MGHPDPKNRSGPITTAFGGQNPAGPHQEVPMDLLWPLLGFCKKETTTKTPNTTKNKTQKQQNNKTCGVGGRRRFWTRRNAATQRFNGFFFGFGIKVTASPSWRDPTWSGRGFSLPGLTKGGRNTSRSEVMWNGDF